jgi:hypothetical protein
VGLINRLIDLIVVSISHCTPVSTCGTSEVGTVFVSYTSINLGGGETDLSKVFLIKDGNQDHFIPQ